MLTIYPVYFYIYVDIYSMNVVYLRCQTVFYFLVWNKKGILRKLGLNYINMLANVLNKSRIYFKKVGFELYKQCKLC